jgi:hypothetical protein
VTLFHPLYLDFGTAAAAAAVSPQDHGNNNNKRKRQDDDDDDDGSNQNGRENIVENGRLMNIVPSSSMVALKSANLCPICLESVILPLPPSKQEEPANEINRIGATSCGHCCHADCFGKYQRRFIVDNGKTAVDHCRWVVPCPTCQSTVTLFHPLYLDFGATVAVDVPAEPQQPEGRS